MKIHQKKCDFLDESLRNAEILPGSNQVPYPNVKDGVSIFAQRWRWNPQLPHLRDSIDQGIQGLLDSAVGGELEEHVGAGTLAHGYYGIIWAI